MDWQADALRALKMLHVVRICMYILNLYIKTIYLAL